MGIQDKVLNVFANPSVAALLWLGATTGLSIELYNPGAILPGVVGVICLVLGLLVSQVIPVTLAGVLLLAVGAMLIGLELFIPSGILGIGGLISIVLGSIYLIDPQAVPGMSVGLGFILPTAVFVGGILFIVVRSAVKTMKRKLQTGFEGLIGEVGEAVENFADKGKVLVHGETWSAVPTTGLIEKGDRVRVVGVRDGLVVEVERVEDSADK